MSSMFQSSQVKIHDKASYFNITLKGYHTSYNGYSGPFYQWKDDKNNV